MIEREWEETIPDCSRDHGSEAVGSISVTLSIWQTTSWKSSLVEYSQPIK